MRGVCVPSKLSILSISCTSLLSFFSTVFQLNESGVLSRSLNPPRSLPSKICLAKGDISAMRENNTSKSGRIISTPVTLVGILRGFSFGNTDVANAASFPRLCQAGLNVSPLISYVGCARDCSVGRIVDANAVSLLRPPVNSLLAVRHVRTVAAESAQALVNAAAESNSCTSRKRSCGSISNSDALSMSSILILLVWLALMDRSDVM